MINRSGVTYTISILWLFGFLMFLFRWASANESTIESYTIGHGTLWSGRTDGIDAIITDRFFGNGTARASISYKVREDSGTITLRVWRNVKPGEIVFALLVFRVEVRGMNASDEVVYTQDPQGFTFGDSKPGNWKRVLTNVPPEAIKIRVTFIGNYE